MTEIGHPFSKPFQELIDSLEESVREGVEQPAQVDVLFRKDTPSYELKGPVHDVSRVTGLRRRQFVVFERNVHYRYASGRLLWNAPANPADPDWYPDDNSRVLVEYTYRDLPSGITDFNAGSVAGTLVRAVARELKFLYEQMDQAYRRAFIDIAQGVALDNVVALLGIVRNQALPATGFVTFFLKKPPRTGTKVVISPKTRVADTQGRLFVVTEGGFIESTLAEVRTQTGGVLKTANRIGVLTHVRVKGTTTNLPTKPTVTGKDFGADERTITLNDVSPAGDLVVTYQPKSVTLPVTALEPGREGNVGSGSITVMPTPPRGVDGGVTNEDPLIGGEAAEGDDQLRERAKHALERAGNATLNAIKYSILEVDGVEGVEVRDHATDETIPLGEVRVRYSGGDEATLVKAIDETRAAGILVRVEAITSVFLSGKVYVIPDAGLAADSLDTLKRAVVATLRALGIGEAAYVRRLTALAYQVAGIADVAEAQLDFAKKKPGEALPSETGQVTDPFVVKSSELIRPDESNLTVVALDGLKATGVYVPAQNRTNLTLSVVKGDGTAVRFRSFTLNVVVVLRARLKTAPDQPAQRVCQVEKQVTFTSSADTVVVSILNADIKDAPGHPGFRLGADGHDPHVEFQVSSTAYPALKPGLSPVDITGIS
ncbi:baseplate J/gp47 family protein [Pyxidicoccus sp. MSG2]|uniref:baseplate J/gp47 family protein n=1 Tax=Pyxidicoccus sp. MSG2 TaxID=2996790 RepID=UPI00226FEB44|nr:baseplate J/gp47 family protein [Pyxidicoccus sp. MSG2]MCY1022313.1 baseplate J/gp47 family protein [Pyxidicoccus sp. MSG2]